MRFTVVIELRRRSSDKVGVGKPGSTDIVVVGGKDPGPLQCPCGAGGETIHVEGLVENIAEHWRVTLGWCENR